jgi:hypothetical protein
MAERAIDRLDPSMSGKPVYEQPDYSSYVFEWKPGTVFVHWELNQHLDAPDTLEGKPPARNVTYGRALSLARARVKAFAAMATEVAAQMDHPQQPGGVEDGNELMRKVGKDPRDPARDEAVRAGPGRDHMR